MYSYDDIPTIEQYVRTIIPAPRELRIERVAVGVSTIVYRIGGSEHTYFLRICPEIGESLVGEVAVHRRLASMGLRVPTVLHFEPHHPVFQRSLMLTTSIPGRAIDCMEPPDAVHDIVRHAGRELGRINQVAVQGYGWVNGTASGSNVLAAEYPLLTHWLMRHFADPLRALAGHHELSQDVDRLAHLLDRACEVFRDEAAFLAHGDFDVTHIYFQHDTYTGIIDFGEIRGTHWIYDLAHFAIECRPLLPYLLDGYRDIRPFAAADMQKLNLTSLLIAARRVGRRVLQGRVAHPPDVACIVSLLSTFECNSYG